jgi:hypothetical protein
MERRNFIKNASLIPLSIWVSNAYGFQNNSPFDRDKEIKGLLPAQIPDNIIAFIRNIVNYPSHKLGIREGDNAVIEAVLKLSDIGFKPGLEYANNWFQNLLKNPPKWNEKNRNRIIYNGIIPFSLYAGNYGLSFSCYELYKRTKNQQARQLCLNIADAILHFAARDHDGLVAHDDVHFLQWAIPDVAYFVIEPLMVASILDKQNKPVYVKQALYQTHQYFTVFYDQDLGIIKTIRFIESGLGNTYWCRAIGWLIFAIGGILRYLDPKHPDYPKIKFYLEKLAEGALKYQGPEGGLRAFVNDPDAPEEITGTAMCAKIINEGIRKDWLSNDYEIFVQKAKTFIFNNIDENGKTQKAYIRWAIPAEQGILELGNFFSKNSLGYSGFLLSCICELMFNKT